MQVSMFPYSEPTPPHMAVPRCVWLLRWAIVLEETDEEGNPKDVLFTQSEWTSINALSENADLPGPSFTENVQIARFAAERFRVELHCRSFVRDTVQVVASFDQDEFESVGYCITMIPKKKAQIIIGMKVTAKDGRTFRFFRDGGILVEPKGA